MFEFSFRTAAPFGRKWRRMELTENVCNKNKKKSVSEFYSTERSNTAFLQIIFTIEKTRQPDESFQ